MIYFKKSNIAGIWAISIIAIFTLALLYITISQPMDKLDDALGSKVPAQFQETYQKIIGSYKIWPVVMVVGILIGAVLYSTKQPDSEVGGFI